MICKAWPPKPILVTKNQTIMEKERKIAAPDGCEIEKVEIVDGVAVVTFKEKERKLPKSWEEFCEMFPELNENEAIVSSGTCTIYEAVDCRTEDKLKRNKTHDRTWLPDRATAEAVLSLCQLIQLRNAYNGDWKPEWKGYCTNCRKYTIEFNGGEIETSRTESLSSSPLYFKTEELRDEFLENFRPLIEKLKPLYGIKENDNK